jgi:putative oxidoreductase
MPALPRSVDPAARLLVSLLFLVSGTTKLTETAPLQAYMQAHGVPGTLIWPAAAWEIGAGLLFLAGFGIRPLAVLLAGWCLLTAAVFHTAFGDANQLINFLKNLTMAGAFLLLARSHPMALSVDGYLAARNGAAR